MAGTAHLLESDTLREWSGTHVDVVDDRSWGPPPAAAARIACRLVELVGQAHERGLALPGLGPAAVLVGPSGQVSVLVPARSGGPADRAADLVGLAGALCQLATGIDPELRADAADPAAQRDRVAQLLAEQAVGNPCAADLAPLVLALLLPDPADRPGPDAAQMLLTGRAPHTGPARVRLGAPRPGTPVTASR
jgi:hypothetical protein